MPAAGTRCGFGVRGQCRGAPVRKADETRWTSAWRAAARAVAGLRDGATLMVGGFGSAGLPAALINAVLDGARAG